MKREKKRRRKLARKFKEFERSLMARYGYLTVQELEHERKMRNKALRLAKKREVGYVV